MKSGYVPFEEVIADIKQETGIENLEAMYDKIRRMIFDAERAIGYGGSVIRKRVKYTYDNNTFNGTKIILPTDFLELNGISFNNDEQFLESFRYTYTPRRIFLRDKTDAKELYLTYYGMVCDGFGNPLTTWNHKEAVVAYIVYKLYAPKVFQGRRNSNRNLFNEYKKEYYDRLLEARGDDAFPNNWQEHEQIGDIMAMSKMDLISYGYMDVTNHYDNPPDCVLADSVIIDEDTPVVTTVFNWQYDSLTTNISDAENITQGFLNTLENYPLEDYANSKLITYTTVGRIAFAIQESLSTDIYEIYDTLGSNITSTVFDKYYHIGLKAMIFVSKEYYAHGTIQFKIVKLFKPTKL